MALRRRLVFDALRVAEPRVDAPAPQPQSLRPAHGPTLRTNEHQAPFGGVRPSGHREYMCAWTSQPPRPSRQHVNMSRLSYCRAATFYRTFHTSGSSLRAQKSRGGSGKKANKPPKDSKPKASKESKPNKTSKESKPEPSSGESRTVIYSIVSLTKILPTRRVLFRDISLGFFQGAKSVSLPLRQHAVLGLFRSPPSSLLSFCRIGVIGLNGSGKSSLMKIIGGKDPEFDGEVVSRPGLKIGYLAQVCSHLRLRNSLGWD